MYFDTHAHYNDRRFDSDRDELIRAMHERGVSLVLNPGCDLETSQFAVKLAETYDFFYAAAGVHPHEAAAMTEADFSEIESLLDHPKVVAVGEIGLDYYYNHSPRDVQKAVFRRQMEWARARNLPVIVHDRDAHADSLEIVKEFPGVRGVFHCFSGSWEFAKELLRLGWYISFTGSVTFKNAAKLPEVAKSLPDDRIMIETDAPYLSPEPVRGKRNDSRNLEHICARIAELRGVSTEELAALTLKNGRELFQIPHQKQK